MREAVASINSEGADELYTQACSRHKSAGELRQCNQLDMGQNSSHPLTVLMPPRDQTGEKLAVQNGNMCQVVCDVNGGGQMVLLNHCSPSQIIHPMVLGHSVSSAEPPLYTADHPHSPEHCPLQGRGDGPVSQVPGGYTSPPYLSSFTNSNTHPSSNLISTAPGYTFNTMPGPYTSQFHQTPCAARADTVETRHSGAQTVRAWERSKKPCNCTKSQCLKLYCDCFANGEFCSNCKCINCCNNMEHESERYRAIKTCLERNPAAFRPKISNRKLGDVKNRHTKGCNCKRSGCLKNYCECYEAKIMCSSTCKCVGCRNYDGSPVRQHTAWQSPDATDIYSTGSKCPLSCITSDVVEATCGCLLAQAEEAEREGHTRPHAERLILEEFGQCLTQIVRSIFKSTAFGGLIWAVFRDRTVYEPEPFLTVGSIEPGALRLLMGIKRQKRTEPIRIISSVSSAAFPGREKMIARTRVLWTCSVVFVILVAESECVQKTTLSKNWGPQSMLYLKGKYGRRFVPDRDDNIYNSGLKSWYTFIKEFEKLKAVAAGRPTRFFTAQNMLIHYTE
ncbi:hypothetical protein SRHO_G00117570 [Serrasalmus rhombeus]